MKERTFVSKFVFSKPRLELPRLMTSCLHLSSNVSSFTSISLSFYSPSDLCDFSISYDFLCPSSFEIPGVDFWGLLNPDWKLCKEGKRQSPVDITPSSLVFDPLLRPLFIDKSRVKKSQIKEYIRPILYLAISNKTDNRLKLVKVCNCMKCRSHSVCFS